MGGLGQLDVLSKHPTERLVGSPRTSLCFHVCQMLERVLSRSALLGYAMTSICCPDSCIINAMSELCLYLMPIRFAFT